MSRNQKGSAFGCDEKMKSWSQIRCRNLNQLNLTNVIPYAYITIQNYFFRYIIGYRHARTEHIVIREAQHNDRVGFVEWKSLDLYQPIFIW